MAGKILTKQTLLTDQLVDKKKDLENWLHDNFQNRNMLGGYGNGLPNFKLYDMTSAEIVVETIYETETVHISEKTWRPIACGFPALFLLNPANLDYLSSLGYRLSSHEFYTKLQSCQSYDDVFDVLQDAIRGLDHGVLLSDAEYNFNHFWRFHSEWTDFVPQLKNIFGYSPIEMLGHKINEL